MLFNRITVQTKRVNVDVLKLVDVMDVINDRESSRIPERRQKERKTRVFSAPILNTPLQFGL